MSHEHQVFKTSNRLDLDMILHSKMESRKMLLPSSIYILQVVLRSHKSKNGRSIHTPMAKFFPKNSYIHIITEM